MLTDSQSHVKRKTIKTPHRPTSRGERSVAFGRNQTVFEPRITQIPRIRFADLAPSIRVICGIRCFYVLLYHGLVPSSSKMLVKKTRCCASAMHRPAKEMPRVGWGLPHRSSDNQLRTTIFSPRMDADSCRVGCAHRLLKIRLAQRRRNAGERRFFITNN